MSPHTHTTASDQTIDLRVFETYERAFTALNAAVPSRQSMTFDELNEALAHPSTVRCAAHGNPAVELPVVTPLAVHDWLSVDYFAARYPHLRVDQIFHISSNVALLAAVDLAPVATFLSHIANEPHLLITDFPIFDGTDPTLAAIGLPPALIDVLGTTGRRVSSLEEIGVQHYFAGRLERCETCDPPVNERVDLARTYALGTKAGLFDDMTAVGVVMLDTLNDAQIAQSWDLYVRYIESLNYDTPVLESLDYATFVAEMRDPVVHKFVSIRDGEIVSMCFLSADLDRYGWISPEHLLSHYPDDYARGNIFEFPGLFTDVSARGSAHSGRVMRLANRVLHAAGTSPQVVFDCPEQTYRVVSGFTSAIVNRSGIARVDLNNISQQRYVAVRLG